MFPITSLSISEMERKLDETGCNGVFCCEVDGRDRISVNYRNSMKSAQPLELRMLVSKDCGFLIRRNYGELFSNF